MRLLARQHAFGGFGRFEAARADGSGSVAVCTRHHAVDWNYVGTRRTRPNKWRVVPSAPGGPRGGGVGEGVDEWLELAFADGQDGAPYYHEKWVRRAGGATEPALVLRACGGDGGAAGGGARDAMLVVVGDYFAYVVERPVAAAQLAPLGGSLAAVVDAAVAGGERALAEACISMEAGHGRVSRGWRVEASLQPWRVGRALGDVMGGGGAADDLPMIRAALESDGAERAELMDGAPRPLRVGGVDFARLSSSVGR